MKKNLLDDDFTPEELSDDEDQMPRGRNFERQVKIKSRLMAGMFMWFGGGWLL